MARYTPIHCLMKWIIMIFLSLTFLPLTIFDTGKQLLNEKIDSSKIVRRRTYQAILSFDVFYKLLIDKKPEFTTFFTNHVASSMHRYWAALFPKEYKDLKYDMKWIQTYSNEILFTMDKTRFNVKQTCKIRR